MLRYGFPVVSDYCARQFPKQVRRLRATAMLVAAPTRPQSHSNMDGERAKNAGPYVDAYAQTEAVMWPIRGDFTRRRPSGRLSYLWVSMPFSFSNNL